MFHLQKRHLMVAVGIVSIFLNGISVKANTKTTQESLPSLGFSNRLPIAISVPLKELKQRKKGMIFNVTNTGLPVAAQTLLPFFKKEEKLLTATMATEEKIFSSEKKKVDKEVLAATSIPFKELEKKMPKVTLSPIQMETNKQNSINVFDFVQEMQEEEIEEYQKVETIQEQKEMEKVDLYSTGYVRVRNAEDKEKFLLKPGEKVEFLEEKKKTVKIKAKKGNGFVKKSLLVNSSEKAKKAVKENVKTFRTTGYCPCYECSEGYSNNTASGRKARVNHTIAADRSVLPFYTEVYIEGLGRYEVEDVGGGVKGNHIDIYVDKHSECDSKNRYDAEVYVIKG